MSSPKWQDASQIVQAALKRPVQERNAFIAAACLHNDALQQEVEILLRYYAASEGGQAPPTNAPPVKVPEHWSQPRKSGRLPEPPAANAPVDWFISADAPINKSDTAPQRRTTAELPTPDFAQPTKPGVPPGAATTALISELAKGFEDAPPAVEHIPLTSGQNTAPLRDAGQSPASRPGFEQPTVRPVFKQPVPRDSSAQPTFKPLYAQPPKPAPPPPSPANAPPLPTFNTPSIRFDEPPPAQGDQPSWPAARSSMPSQAPSPPPAGGRFPPTSAPRTGPLPSPAPASGTRPLDGRMLAHYQLEYEIGRGGMGRVYLAQDQKLGRRVALKLLLRHSTRDPERVRRFEQEARAASALNHPNILTIHEVGEVRGVHYLATEYVEGRTLRTLIDRGRFKLPIAVEIAIQVASALDSAHRANLVHRDIKPENLMLRHDGYVKVLDFGIAKLVEAARGARSDTPPQPNPYSAVSQPETQPGLVIGTTNYMSPEQARGLRVDRRTDIFSLGIVLYEMVTGISPFKGNTASDTIAALLAREPAPLTNYVTTAPHNVLQELQRILDRALSKDRDRRYQSAKEMAVELKAFKQWLATGSREPQSSGEPVRATSAPPTVNPPVAKAPPVTAPLDAQAPTASTTAPLPANPASQLPPRADQQAKGPEAAPVTQPGTIAETGKLKPLRAKVGQPFYQRKREFWLLAVAALSLAALLAWACYTYYTSRSGQLESIAVLPFEFAKAGGPPARSAGAEADNEAEYLADGMTESLIQRLSQAPGLKVIARNSVFRYKGKLADPHEVGQSLKVRTVLSGRLTPRADGLTVTVELVETGNNNILWAQQYQSRSNELQTLQGTLFNEVVAHLRLQLKGAEQQRLASPDTNNAEAYKLYLKGRHQWNQRKGEEIKRSIGNFLRAVMLDPNYARAYAALADSYMLAPVYSESAPEEAIVAGKEAAAHALELDPQLAEPHAALGFIRHQYEWNWEGAEQAYLRALALNGNYATAHQWYSGFLSSAGRAKEAIAEGERARDLDPVSTPIATNLGAAFYYGRRYPQAVQQFQQALELNPNSAGVHGHLGMAYEQQQQYDLALVAFQRAIALSFDNVQMRLRLARTLALIGKKVEARQQLEAIQQNAPPGSVPLYLIATIYLVLGEREQALAMLTQAVALREESVIWLKVDPQLDPLRDEERFNGLLKSAGFVK